MYATIPLFAVGAALLTGAARIANLHFQWGRGRPTEPILYSSRAYVQQADRRGGWVEWGPGYGGGPVVTVYASHVAISAPQGLMLDSRDVVISAPSASVWMGRIGIVGLPLRERDCIHLRGRNRRGKLSEFAISPVNGTKPAWDALLSAGVASSSPTTGCETR